MREKLGWTDVSHKVVALAREKSLEYSSDYVDTEHLLLALVENKKNPAFQVLNSVGVTRREVREQVTVWAIRGRPPRDDTLERPFTVAGRNAVAQAKLEALQLEHSWMDTLHLLLGILEEPEGGATRILCNLGVEQEEVRHEIMRVLGYDLEESVGN